MSSPQNCISYWLPLIEGKVPTPRTEILRLPGPERDLFPLLDGKPPPEWWGAFILDLRLAAQRISETGPWFLRTGVFSGKHRWRDCCAVTDLGPLEASELECHVASLFEFSQIVDFIGLPCDVWAVREWLPGPALCEYEPFGGMPIRREFRVFAEGGMVLCAHPYWPPDALDELPAELRPALKVMNRLGSERSADYREVMALAQRASAAVPGAWSIDVLSTDRGWYVTDLAIASQSYHWPNCPMDPRRERP